MDHLPRKNEALDSDQFSWAALGLPNGDRVEDEMLGALYEYRDGVLHGPVQRETDSQIVGKSTQDAPVALAPRKQSMSRFAILAIVNIGVVLLFATALLVRRLRRRAR